MKGYAFQGKALLALNQEQKALDSFRKAEDLLQQILTGLPEEYKKLFLSRSDIIEMRQGQPGTTTSR